MMDLRGGAAALVYLSWFAYGAVFVSNGINVAVRRRADPAAESERKSAPAAKWGMGMQAIGLFFAFFRGPECGPAALLILAAILAPASVLLGWLATRELGMQWRIQAVVTDTHQLITTGPYSFLRHPVYASVIGMLAATAFICPVWKYTFAAIAFSVIGTEIRIAAEEKLLSDRFGSEFKNYRSRVPAYIPFLR
jgi:protein-S-isoprenylcysteine O-methyltransferase Ste14